MSLQQLFAWQSRDLITGRASRSQDWLRSGVTLCAQEAIEVSYEYDKTRSGYCRSDISRTSFHMSKISGHLKAAPRNPFIIGHHAEGEGFCDRRTEVDRIADTFRDASARLLVYGDRRLGKSSTIHEAANRVRTEGKAVVIVDLAVASTAPAAAQRILSAVNRELGTRWQDSAIRLLGRLRPGAFSLQAGVDSQGQPSMTFQVTPAVAAQDALLVTEVLDAVEGELTDRNLTLGLGLDEFQRLGRWYGDDVAWQLKEMLERHRRIAYVLAGSERSLIEQMLANRKSGLWKVVEILDMQPVPPAELARWIADRATATGVALDVVTAATIVRLAGPRTRDIVQLARATWDWGRPEGTAARDTAIGAMEALVVEQGALHQRQWERLTEVTKTVLLTVATQPDVQLLAARTLATFALGPKSTVSSALEELTEREILVRRAGETGAYDFDDPFFRRWVQVNVAPASGGAPPALSGTHELGTPPYADDDEGADR